MIVCAASNHGSSTVAFFSLLKFLDFNVMILLINGHYINVIMALKDAKGNSTLLCVVPPPDVFLLRSRCLVVLDCLHKDPNLNLKWFSE